MKQLSILICLGLMLAGQTAYATTYHVFATADNVSPNFTTLGAAVAAATTAGDIISIDDSTTYTLTTGLAINTNDISIVAKAGETPVIQNGLGISGAFCIGINNPGFRLGSITGGTIICDGNKNSRRFLNQASTSAAWTAYGPSVNTYENLIIKNFGTNITQSNNYVLWVLSDGETNIAPVGTVVNFKYIDFQWPAGKPTNAIAGGAAYIGIRVHPVTGTTINVENCRSNTLCGYVLTAGTENATRAVTAGTINVKNCRFVYDDATMTNYRQMGSPIALWGALATANVNGFTLNIDNSYLRSDANNNGIWSPASVNNGATTLAAGTRDTSESLGVVALLNYSKNDLTVTNSAIVGMGTGININSAHARVGLFTSDIYVPGPGQYTPGYFISVAERSMVATSADLQCSATRCNFYGIAGSRINSGPRGAGSVFSMFQCNDWSPENAYADNWVVDSACLHASGTSGPGPNPGYGAMSGEATSPGIAGNDFTVYNNTVKAANIGSNRDFNMGVPVELSAFEVR